MVIFPIKDYHTAIAPCRLACTHFSCCRGQKGFVGLNGQLHMNMIYKWVVIHLST